MALPPPKAGKKPPAGASSAPPADLPPDVGAPPPGLDGGMGGPPPGMPPGGDPMGGAPMGAPGPPQFPSADPNAVLALLMQLDAHDQQQLGVAQVAAAGQAFSALMAAQQDPMAAAAATGPPNVVGPPMGGAPGY